MTTRRQSATPIVTVKADLAKLVDSGGRLTIVVEPHAAAEESSQQPALDQAWAAVNVLGAPDSACANPEDRAYCAAINDALAEIEKLGGRPS